MNKSERVREYLKSSRSLSSSFFQDSLLSFSLSSSLKTHSISHDLSLYFNPIPPLFHLQSNGRFVVEWMGKRETCIASKRVRESLSNSFSSSSSLFLFKDNTVNWTPMDGDYVYKEYIQIEVAMKYPWQRRENEEDSNLENGDWIDLMR